MSMLETIIRVQRAINSADDSVEAVMQIVVDQACEATGAPGAVVEIAEGDEMVYRAAAGSEGLRLPVSCGSASAAGWR
ncbi:hypothetical protein B1R94_24670 [Mycolicibacterium litorale]|nr:hypothetical protein B1R94_24670 [Mycolicibacterium litorale]